MRKPTRIHPWGALLPVLAALLFFAPPAGAADEALPIARPPVTEGPVDEFGYLVGPGDVFQLSVLGQVQNSWTIPVTPEGTITVPPAGAVPVAGLPLSRMKEVVLAALGRYYQGVEIQITLTELRRFEVHVLGQVTTPGTYIVNGLTRVSSVIAMADGFLEDASMRHVRILGADGSTRRADVVRFDVLGERKWNPFVSDGDIVQVPVRIRTCRVFGQVALPGEYEIVEGESLREMIEIAGGFMDDARKERVEVTRFLAEDPSRTRRFFVDFSGDEPRSDEADLSVHSGDEVFVRGIPQWQLHRGVTVEGEVRYPGVYVINEGQEGLSDLIDRCGGFTDDADLYEATLTRPSIRSEAEDREFERLRTVPVADMSEDEYAYFKMRSREDRERVVVDFVALFREGDEERDVLLRRGDVIQVPQISRTVTLSGQVVNPGRLPFKEGLTYKDYIRGAGGFARRASRGKVRVIKGVSGIWFDAGDTTLEPGDTIWVPEKPQRDYWALFKDIMTVSAQIATVYLVVHTATN